MKQEMGDQMFDPLFQEESLLIQIAHLICVAMEENNFRKRDLASMLGISKKKVSKILTADVDLTLRDVANIFTSMDKELVISVRNIGEKTEKTEVMDVFQSMIDSLVKMQQGTDEELEELKREVCGYTTWMVSLGHPELKVIKPIPVLIKKADEDSYTASFVDANVSMSGSSAQEAFYHLQVALAQTFKFHETNDILLAEPMLMQKQALSEVISRTPASDWKTCSKLGN